MTAPRRTLIFASGIRGLRVAPRSPGLRGAVEYQSVRPFPDPRVAGLGATGPCRTRGPKAALGGAGLGHHAEAEAPRDESVLRCGPCEDRVQGRPRRRERHRFPGVPIVRPGPGTCRRVLGFQRGARGKEGGTQAGRRAPKAGVPASTGRISRCARAVGAVRVEHHAKGQRRQPQSCQQRVTHDAEQSHHPASSRGPRQVQCPASAGSRFPPGRRRLDAREPSYPHASRPRRDGIRLEFTGSEAPASHVRFRAPPRWKPCRRPAGPAERCR